jgi:glutamyl-tRNA synthetase
LSATFELGTLALVLVQDVVGRLAPSPTGCLHLGHALSFLGAYWVSKSVGGRLLLRLDDIDTDRSDPTHVQAAIDDLNWLGIAWDGAPKSESKRLEIHLQAVRNLLTAGNAFPCTCTRGILRRYNDDLAEEVRGAPHEGTLEARYPGLCRDRYLTVEEAELADGRSAGVRFLVPDEVVRFEDRVFGSQKYDVRSTVGDFLILRRDHSPAYQLSVVVADALDGVTQIVRGRDLLESTARQRLVARALGLTSPETAHLPLVCDHNGRRLSKRHEALSLMELRSHGVRPEQIVSWVAGALGQERFSEQRSAQSFLDVFDLNRIPTEDIILPSSPSSLFTKMV